MLAKIVLALALLMQAQALAQTFPNLTPFENITYDYYCGKELTCGDIPNIMCNRTTRFPPLCKKPEYVPINDELMKMFLDGHNKLRSEHALGKTGGVFNGTTMADMATMAWDDELELMSLHNAVQCQLIDDKCRRTFNYKTVGQNIHAICETPNHISIDAAVNEAIKTWFNEYKDVKDLDAVQNFGNKPADRPIKHFTQMVQSKADRIGCSIIRYVRKNSMLFNGLRKCTVIGCNYSVGNLNGSPTNKIGAPASQCQSGPNPDYLGLCSSKEDYTKHENAHTYFTNAASPVVAEWVKNNKQIKLGGKQK